MPTTTNEQPWRVHPDRALPADPGVRAIAREILDETAPLPILSMHGHVDAEVLRHDQPFPDPTSLFITPDHYLLRMLVSQGVSLDDLRFPAAGVTEESARAIWRIVSENVRLLRGTPTRYWLEHAFSEVFEVRERLTPESADRIFDHISDRLTTDPYRPRALFDRFGIEILATTDPADATLEHHAHLAADGWGQRVIPTFRPDALLEPSAPAWRGHLDRLASVAQIDTQDYDGFLDAIRARRLSFVEAGARATDHSHAVADTTPLSEGEARRLFTAARAGDIEATEAAAFTGHMLFQMAAMSAADGLVMQVHHGVLRDHDPAAATQYGPNIGFDIPTGMEFTRALRPLLNAYGRDPAFRMIVFTIDESTYSRELAPLAGVYPSLRLGAPWWFLDAPDAMRRFREATTETAGFYNTSGFVDDTRAFCSIPARHDLSRRIDAGYLAELVGQHRLPLDEAIETAIDLAYNLPKASYPPTPGSEYV